ncbi:MAG: hypothetical protein PQJ46_02455, partial [Spirochaetales bacterium]|nr:hypothetical protein [Spirochaetales bacterium]
APGLITQFFGVSVPMMFNSVLYFEPGIRLYASNVVLDSDNRAVLSAVETAYRISLLNCEIRPEIGALFNLSDKISLGITGAPLFTFRIPIVAHDYDDGSEAMSTVGQYFLAKARFLSLYAGGLLVWHATEKVSLEVKLGTSLPFYHFWDGEDSAFYNWLSIEPEVGFIFSF